jgi:fumarate reductase flavoprotein subunit
VVPTAHYFMGGVICDVETRTGLEGLYVAGEDAGGVHGANRLGGNGVANSTVFGGIAGDVMAADVTKHRATLEPDLDQVADEIERTTRPFRFKRGNMTSIRNRLLDGMWENVGIIRTKSLLDRAQAMLDTLRAELQSTGVPDGNRAFNLTWNDWLNLDNQILVSKLIAAAAAKRENTRGSHYRDDFAEPGDLAASRYTVIRLAGDRIEVSDAPVAFTIVKPGETII